MQYPETGRTTEMKRFAVVIEKTSTGYGAYAPDLPGCVAAGDTIEDTERLMREAIEFHLEGMRVHGDRWKYSTARQSTNFTNSC